MTRELNFDETDYEAENMDYYAVIDDDEEETEEVTPEND